MKISQIKYAMIMLLVLSSDVYTCIVGPVQLDVSEQNDFKIEEVMAHSHCESCVSIEITAPKVY